MEPDVEISRRMPICGLYLAFFASFAVKNL